MAGPNHFGGLLAVPGTSPILTREHLECLNRCLEANSRQREILDLAADQFPALAEFREENERLRRIAEEIKRRAFPGEP